MKKDNEVGYKLPPKSGQFKKGKSGNPSGRPKKPKYKEKQLHEIMAELIPFNFNGEEKMICVREAIMWKAARKALEGDIRAIKYLLPRDDKYDEDDESIPLEPVRSIRPIMVDARKKPAEDLGEKSQKDDD